MKQCVHEHGESCYPVAEDSASENTAEREPHICTHECSEESGCITEKLDCRHEHNADCGYSPATEGTPCTYECEACSGQEQINALPNIEDSHKENAEEIELCWLLRQKQQTKCRQEKAQKNPLPNYQRRGVGMVSGYR